MSLIRDQSPAFVAALRLDFPKASPACGRAGSSVDAGMLTVEICRETQEREGRQSDRTKSASGLEDCANHLLTAFAHSLERITSGGARHPSSLN